MEDFHWTPPRPAEIREDVELSGWTSGPFAETEAETAKRREADRWLALGKTREVIPRTRGTIVGTCYVESTMLEFRVNGRWEMRVVLRWVLPITMEVK